jgi:diguanylate cyclase (GGDEF)-like protein
MTPETQPLAQRLFPITVTLVVALVLFLLAFSAIDEIRFAKERFGIDIAPHDQGLLIADVVPDFPADQAGIRSGDVLVRLGDQSTPDLDTLNALIEAWPLPDEPLQLFMLRNDELLEIRLQPGVPPDIAGLLAQLVLVSAYLGLALLAARYRHQDLRARLLMTFVALVAIELALPAGYTLPVILLQAMVLFWLMATGVQIALELHLVSLIPSRLPLLKQQRWLVPGYYLLGLGIGISLCALTLLQWYGLGERLPGFLASADSLVLTAWAAGIALLLGYQIWRTQDPRGRNQALLVLIGLLPWAVYIFVSVFWSGWGSLNRSWTEQVENLVLLFFPAAVFVAIFRYGLFDVENLVRRSLVFGSVAVLVLILLYTLLTGALPWLIEVLGMDIGVWLITALALLTGILFRPLRNGIERLVEKGLFPERRALRHRLIQIAGALSNQDDMNELVKRLAEETQRALRLDWVTVVAIDDSDRRLHEASSDRLSEAAHQTLVKLLDTGSAVFANLSQTQRPTTTRRLARRQPEAAEALASLGADVLVPLFFQNRMIGILCLSHKLNGELFRREELELLDLFSHQIAASFENLRLFKDAHYERLTGLMRREAVLRQLDIEFEHAARHDHELAVLMIDLDHFKSVNDAHGHLFGDQVLRRVAETMQESIRAADALGRYGGEEFLLVLPNTNAEGALKLAEKLRRAVSSLRFHPAAGPPVKITVSIGVGSLRADQMALPGLPDALLASADSALYQAKSGGRDRIVVSESFA